MTQEHKFFQILECLRLTARKSITLAGVTITSWSDIPGGEVEASDVEVQDIENYYISNDVEGIFAEIGETRSINLLFSR